MGKPKSTRQTRASTQQQTHVSKVKKIQADYKKGKPQRERKQTVRYVPPCRNTNTYHHPWTPADVDITLSVIEVRQSNNQDAKNSVEQLGEKGAKWYLAIALKKAIEDGQAPFKAGYFYSFSGAHTFDIVYVNPTNNHVYVLEAKGTKKGAAANLITRNNGKKQGNWNYLDEVAQEMANSGDALKQEAAARIMNAPTGKLHYIGVHTKYETDVNGRVTSPALPKEIFNKTR
jgi:hypothetical protein